MAAAAAAALVRPGEVLGVGTGSTINHFIGELAGVRAKIEAVVASSEATAERLAAAGFRAEPLSTTGPPTLYVDGADEIDAHRRMIKGGGGALAREKVLAYCARRFACIVDDTKRVEMLGAFALPVEVIPFARSQAAARLAAMGGAPAWRERFVTDNGNHVLDVPNLPFADPLALEDEINRIPGVLENGVFARRRADAVVVASAAGVEVEGDA